jgi:Leucine-rich repeat (LRR) protein
MSAHHTCIANMCHFADDDRSSKERWIPADLVQNTAEYLGRVAGFLSFRGVSITWQGAVSDAVGFLNGRCWTELSIHSPLFVTLCLDDGAAVDRCALLCLGPRLETLAGRFPFPSGLLGEENNALTTLTLRHGTTDMRGLKNCRALKKLYFDSDSMGDAKVRNVSIRGLELIPALEDINLQRCSCVTDVSYLRDSRALKVLNLSRTSVTDGGIRGLELIPTLKDLNLAGCKQLTDVSRLRDSRALKKLSISCCNVTDAGIRGLELIPTLEDLALTSCTHVTDVSCLRNSRSLKKLDLSCNNVTDDDMRGLDSFTH